MKCAEFHDQAPAYALDALPEEERLACLHHLTAEGPHEGCDELVARYARTVGELSALVVPVAVPASAWRVIEARLGLAGEPSNVVPIDASPARSPTPVDGKPKALAGRWREGIAWAAAAAALLAALWSHQTAQRTASTAERERETIEQALSNTSQQLASEQRTRADCSAALAQLTRHNALGRDAVSLLEHPETKLTPMAPVGAETYRATALFNPTTKRALVISSTVTQVAGKDYELWVIAAGEAPRAAGFMRFDASGVSIGEFDSALLLGPVPAALAVSLEPAGGAPTPTQVVLLAKLQG